MSAWCLCWWLVLAWADGRVRELGPYTAAAACERSALVALAAWDHDPMAHDWGGRPSRWSCERRDARTEARQ